MFAQACVRILLECFLVFLQCVMLDTSGLLRLTNVSPVVIYKPTHFNQLLVTPRRVPLVTQILLLMLDTPPMVC